MRYILRIYTTEDIYYIYPIYLQKVKCTENRIFSSEICRTDENWENITIKLKRGILFEDYRI